MSSQALIAKYEAELHTIGVDQRTDDAMPPDAYRARRDVLERVITDLKAEAAADDQPVKVECIDAFLARLGFDSSKIKHDYIGPYEIVGLNVDDHQIQFHLRDGYFQHIEVGPASD